MDGLEGTERDRRRDEPRSRLGENAVPIASMLVTGIWLAGLLTGQSWWLPALIVGYAAVIPVVATLFGDDAEHAQWADEEPASETRTDTTGTERSHSRTSGRDALETLRERYAAGELTDDQFERKLERLLETGTLEDADEWVRDRERGSDHAREAERNREYDR